MDVPDEVAGDHFDGVAADFGIACGGPDQPEQVLTLRDRRKIPGAHSEGSIWHAVLVARLVVRAGTEVVFCAGFRVGRAAPYMTEEVATVKPLRVLGVMSGNHHRTPHRWHRPGPRTLRARHRHPRIESRPQRPRRPLQRPAPPSDHDTPQQQDKTGNLPELTQKT